MRLRAAFGALCAVVFCGHRGNVERVLREYDSVILPLLISYRCNLVDLVVMLVVIRLEAVLA